MPSVKAFVEWDGFSNTYIFGHKKTFWTIEQIRKYLRRDISNYLHINLASPNDYSDS